MTTMKLELPTDNATVLFHMSTALRNIAIDAGYIDSSELMSMEEMIEQIDEEAVTPPTDAEQYGKSLADHDDVSSEIPELIDSKGLPWDKRIHSRGKTRLSDDTWRMARKPADKDDDEWSAYVEEVETELLELMEIPVAVEYTPSDEGYPQITVTPPVVTETVTPPVADVVPPAVTETVTPPAVTETVTPPAVTETVTPPAVTETVTPPVVTEAITPPVVTETITPPVVSNDAPTTFPLFMKWLTTNNKSLTKDGIDAVLKSHGISSIALLMPRPDLIPQIHADLVKSI